MKPVILIVHRFDADPSGFGIGGIYKIQANYCRAISMAGGTPIISALGDARIYAEIADGIVFTGSSSDIEPARYGQENRRSVSCDARLDEMELALFNAFYARKKPILGICRGIQLINVALGGTLVQDVREEVPGLTVHEKVYQKLTEQHPVTAREGSLLHSLFGGSFLTNSYHHQAIGKCGEGLIPTAATEDGVIEGVEHKTMPILAVQWHPERMIGEEKTMLPNMLPLFRRFISLCGK